MGLALRLGEGEGELVVQAEALPAARAPPVAVTEPDLEEESVPAPLLLGETSTVGLATQGE